MLDRGCQLWIREARKGNITDTSKTLEKIRYQLRLERRVAGQSGSGLRRPVGRDKNPIRMGTVQSRIGKTYNL